MDYPHFYKIASQKRSKRVTGYSSWKEEVFGVCSRLWQISRFWKVKSVEFMRQVYQYDIWLGLTQLNNILITEPI